METMEIDIRNLKNHEFSTISSLRDMTDTIILVKEGCTDLYF